MNSTTGINVGVTTSSNIWGFDPLSIIQASTVFVKKLLDVKGSFKVDEVGSFEVNSESVFNNKVTVNAEIAAGNVVMNTLTVAGDITGQSNLIVDDSITADSVTSQSINTQSVISHSVTASTSINCTSPLNAGIIYGDNVNGINSTFSNLVTTSATVNNTLTVNGETAINSDAVIEGELRTGSLIVETVSEFTGEANFDQVTVETIEGVDALFDTVECTELITLG